MTAAVQQISDPRLENFRPLASGADAALAGLRLPTRHDESWRYLKVNDLFGQSWALARPVVDAARIENRPGLMIINGRLWAGLNELPQGVVRLAAVPAPAAVLGDHGPAALNAALAPEPLALQVASGRPVTLKMSYLTIPGHEQELSPSRVVLQVADGADLTLHLDSLGGDAALTWMDTVIDLRLGGGARVRILASVRDAGRHTQVVAATLAQDAELSLTDVVFGGRLTRRETQVALTGSGAVATLHAAYLGADADHIDLFTQVQHLSPGCHSVQVLRGVLDGKATASFQGRIVVAPHAQKTDAHQSSRSLLLSRAATANAKPELEIHADDVKCSHGATVGELDPASLFYLMSRGIPEHQARAMLVDAFIGEVLDAIADTEAAQRLREDVAAWMAGREQQP